MLYILTQVQQQYHGEDEVCSANPVITRGQFYDSRIVKCEINKFAFKVDKSLDDHTQNS